VQKNPVQLLICPRKAVKYNFSQDTTLERKISINKEIKLVKLIYAQKRKNNLPNRVNYY
jgi:hypothetical protein